MPKLATPLSPEETVMVRPMAASFMASVLNIERVDAGVSCHKKIE